jgi:hypothetical protein
MVEAKALGTTAIFSIRIRRRITTSPTNQPGNIRHKSVVADSYIA